MTYEEYLKSPEWAALKESTKKRDGYRCRLCNSDKEPRVHHRTYERVGRERLEDLTTLCRICHKLFHWAVKVVRPPIGEWIDDVTPKEERPKSPDLVELHRAMDEAAEAGDDKKRKQLIEDWMEKRRLASDSTKIRRER